MHEEAAMRRKIKFIVIAVVVAIIALPLAGLAWRSSLQDEVARARAISSPGGIDTLDVVDIGGTRQAIRVRGRDRSSPVLLFVHGGPGTPMMPFAHVFQDSWEEHFVVVNWDQRGAGKTYYLNDVEKTKASMSFERMQADVLEMTNYLRKRFGQQKIFIIGHSFGSQISLPVVKSHPELYYAFIGTGQIINGIRGNQNTFDHTLLLAEKMGHKDAVRELKAVGGALTSENALKDPKAWNHAVGVLQYWNQEFGESMFGYTSRAEPMAKFALQSPDYSLKDIWILMNVDWDLYAPLYQPRMAFDAYAFGKTWEVPLFLLEGRFDWQINHVHAKEFYDFVEAPHKEYYYFERSAHAPMVEDKDRFSEVLIKRVRPLAGDRPLEPVTSFGEHWVNAEHHGRQWKAVGPSWTP